MVDKPVWVRHCSACSEWFRVVNGVYETIYCSKNPNNCVVS